MATVRRAWRIYMEANRSPLPAGPARTIVLMNAGIVFVNVMVPALGLLIGSLSWAWPVNVLIAAIFCVSLKASIIRYRNALALRAEQRDFDQIVVKYRES